MLWEIKFHEKTGPHYSYNYSIFVYCKVKAQQYAAVGVTIPASLSWTGGIVNFTASNDTLYLLTIYNNSQSQVSHAILKYDGFNWELLDTFSIMAGSVGTTFLKKWNGTSWMTLFQGNANVDINIRDIKSFDNQIFIGGCSTNFSGILGLNNNNWNGFNFNPNANINNFGFL